MRQERNKLITEGMNDYACVVSRWDSGLAGTAGNLILPGAEEEDGWRQVAQLSLEVTFLLI